MSMVRPQKLLRFPAIIGTRADVVPTWPVELDRTHPLAQGLVTCFLGNSPVDYAANINWSATGGASTIIGPALNPIGASYPTFLTSTKVITGGTLFWVGVFASIPVNGIGYVLIGDAKSGGAPYLSSQLGFNSQQSSTNAAFFYNQGGTFTATTLTNIVPNASKLAKIAVAFQVGGSVNSMYNGSIASQTAWSGAAPSYYAGQQTMIIGQSYSSPTNAAMRWNNQLSANMLLWLNAEPFAMLRPVIRRGYYFRNSGAFTYSGMATNAALARSNKSIATAHLTSSSSTAASARAIAILRAATVASVAASNRQTVEAHIALASSVATSIRTPSLSRIATAASLAISMKATARAILAISAPIATSTRVAAFLRAGLATAASIASARRSIIIGRLAVGTSVAKVALAIAMQRVASSATLASTTRFSAVMRAVLASSSSLALSNRISAITRSANSSAIAFLGRSTATIVRTASASMANIYRATIKAISAVSEAVAFVPRGFFYVASALSLARASVIAVVKGAPVVTRILNLRYVNRILNLKYVNRIINLPWE